MRFEVGQKMTALAARNLWHRKINVTAPNSELYRNKKGALNRQVLEGTVKLQTTIGENDVEHHFTRIKRGELH